MSAKQKLAELNPHLFARFGGWLDEDKRLIGYRRFHLVLLGLSLLFLAQGFAFGYLLREQRRERAASCQRTYEGVRAVFQPFLGSPAERSPEMQADVAKFNKRVEELKAGCSQQIRGKQPLPTKGKR